MSSHCTSTFPAFWGGSSLEETEAAALLSLSFRSVGPAVLQGFLCEECSSAERGKYQAALESPVLKTLLATSVLAGGTGWERYRGPSI